MKITIYVARGFSKNHKGGNKAGVVLMEQKLNNAQKLAIAQQLGYSETAFLSKSERADYQVAYFTPKEEVDLCGHATIASFSILRHLNQLYKDHYTIETNSGILEIKVEDDVIFMEQNKPVFYDVLMLNELINCFDSQAIDSKYPIQIVSTGLKDILVPIKSEEQLRTLQPNFEEIKAVSKEYNVIGMHLFTFKEAHMACRNFAPLYEINEEAATGTANAALACYLYEKGDTQRENYVFEQGESLKSPSEILVKLATNDQKKIKNVYVGGKGDYCETQYLNI